MGNYIKKHKVKFIYGLLLLSLFLSFELIVYMKSGEEKITLKKTEKIKKTIPFYVGYEGFLVETGSFDVIATKKDVIGVLKFENINPGELYAIYGCYEKYKQSEEAANQLYDLIVESETGVNSKNVNGLDVINRKYDVMEKRKACELHNDAGFVANFLFSNSVTQRKEVIEGQKIGSLINKKKYRRRYKLIGNLNSDVDRKALVVGKRVKLTKYNDVHGVISEVSESGVEIKAFVTLTDQLKAEELNIVVAHSIKLNVNEYERESKISNGDFNEIR